MRRRGVSTLAVCFVGFGVTTALADTINVPGDFTTIQTAINAATDGDDILVARGTYNEHIDTLGKAVWVHSSTGFQDTTIDGGGTGSVVSVVSFEDSDTIIEGFTLTDGNSADGGGLRIEFSSPTIIDCRMIGNTAPSDGNFRMIDGNGVGAVTVDMGAYEFDPAQAALCPADVDGSGTVDVQDLVAVILAWGQAGGAADINEDGIVDVQDVVAVVLSWGPCP